jgi:hypothetical protein
MVRRLGDVGRLIEMGTSIGITRRNIAKNMIIRLYDCVFQYDRWLKTERYDNKQVVLTLSLTELYQGFSFEVILRYGNGDISRSSLVFCCSKDDEADRRTTTSINPRHKNFSVNEVTFINLKQKCPSGNSERWLHSNEPFIAQKDRKSDCILTKNLYSRKEELGRHPRRELSNERVANTSRSDSPK